MSRVYELEQKYYTQYLYRFIVIKKLGINLWVRLFTFNFLLLQMHLVLS